MNSQIMTLQNGVAGNQHEKVFTTLLEIVRSDAELQNQVLTLKARYNEIKKLEIIGAITSGESFMHRANLNMSLLNLITQIADRYDNQRSRGVFISYSHADAAVASRIREKLLANGIPVIMDSDKLVAGEEIAAFIRESISQTEVTLSIISRKSLLSSWVAMETITTFQREKKPGMPRFIGCYVENDFFNREFTGDAIQSIEEEMHSLIELKRKRLDQGLNTRDLDNEFTRWSELRHNLDEIVRRLREHLCIDVREPVLENNFPQILQAIRNPPK